MSDSSLTEGVWVRTEDPPARPPAAQRFRRGVRLAGSLRELWHSREMVRSVAEREFRARYKQTYLGYAWAVITPVTLVIVFSLFFRRVAHVDTGGAPYALFAYLGLLPWGFFSTSVSNGGMSLITNVSLLNKVYCPREVFPIGSVTIAMVDTLISFSALIVLFIADGRVPRSEAVWLPVLWVIEIAFTLGVVFIISSVVVYFRDLKATLPLVLQLGLFATPVAYGLNDVPKSFRTLYVVLNPQAAVIDTSRRTALFGLSPNYGQLGLAALSSFAVLGFGYFVFKRLETGIADVA